jgi:trehalose 2-sulfotransferase
MNGFSKLYAADHDFPEWRGEPLRSVLFAAIPRSGSTMLSLLLWRTGVLGAPMEYTNLVNRQRDMLQRLSPGGDLLRYWEEVKAKRTSPYGIFSFKAFQTDNRLIGEHCPQILRMIGADDIIFMVRRDKLAQAVSWARAVQTKKWFVHDAETAPAEYSRAGVDAALNWVMDSERAWETVFAQNGLAPIRVFYEDIVDNPHAVVATILCELGIERGQSSTIFLPDTVIQRDALNEQWRQRYLSETRELPLDRPSLRHRSQAKVESSEMPVFIVSQPLRKSRSCQV